jgi:2-oxo-4-hydroxy-4-carboxy-5-ureidoimidazoline decarboxylase
MPDAPAPAPAQPSSGPLAWLNGADAPAVLAALRGVCAARAWGEHLLAARPFAGLPALLAAAEAAVAALDDAGLAKALAGHPPIGRPTPGDAVSAREQSGMAGADAALAAEMRELNVAYQERFGHVFLICATGLSGAAMRDALRARLAHDPVTEEATVRAELTKINVLRLTRLAEGAATVSTHILDTTAGRPAAGVPVAVALALAPAGAPAGADPAWLPHATAVTDADGRCAGLPALPNGAVAARLTFAVAPHLAGRAPGGAPAFFPEVTVAFAVVPGEHFHVPLLLNPHGYTVYRGS